MNQAEKTDQFLVCLLLFNKISSFTMWLTSYMMSKLSLVPTLCVLMRSFSRPLSCRSCRFSVGGFGMFVLSGMTGLSMLSLFCWKSLLKILGISFWCFEGRQNGANGACRISCVWIFKRFHWLCPHLMPRQFLHRWQNAMPGLFRARNELL